MRQREIGFVDVPIYRSAAAAARAAARAAVVGDRHGGGNSGSNGGSAARRSKNPSNGFGGEKMRFTFGVDLTRAMLLQY